MRSYRNIRFNKTWKRKADDARKPWKTSGFQQPRWRTDHAFSIPNPATSGTGPRHHCLHGRTFRKRCRQPECARLPQRLVHTVRVPNFPENAAPTGTARLHKLLAVSAYRLPAANAAHTRIGRLRKCGHLSCACMERPHSRKGHAPARAGPADVDGHDVAPGPVGPRPDECRGLRVGPCLANAAPGPPPSKR